MDVNKFEKGQAAVKAAEIINQTLIEYRDGILLLVSGGSALKIIDFIDTENINPDLTIGVTDERFSNDKKINNYLQLKNTKFWAEAATKKANFLETVPLPGDSPEKMAGRYERSLRGWKRERPNGTVIMTLGIGPDGHTAGIMPYPENPVYFRQLFESENWVVGYNCDNKNPFPLRVTTSLTYLREEVDKSIVYATGPEKIKLVKKIQAESLQSEEMPAVIIKQMKQVMVITE